MSLVAIVPLVVVLLALSGCSTNPATGITSHSAYLNGDGFCPAAGHSFTHWYQLWDADTIYNGPQRLTNCGSESAVVPLPSDNFDDLMSGTLHCFVVKAQYHSPINELMHFDANGDKNGGAFDCFTTESAAAVDVIELPSYPEAGASGPPSSGLYGHTRAVAKSFWQNYGEWGSCMENNTRQTSASYTQKMRFIDDNGTVNNTSFKKIHQQLNYNTGAISIGCNSRNYGQTNNPDARIIYNESIGWGTVRHCVTGAHEWGHQRGFTHHNQTFRIMRGPLYLDFPWC